MNHHSASSDEEEADDMNERHENEIEDTRVDYKAKVQQGSYLPAMVLLELNQISVEEAIDHN